eukprot:754644-Hanusia_phi.AAC.2
MKEGQGGIGGAGGKALISATGEATIYACASCVDGKSCGARHRSSGEQGASDGERKYGRRERRGGGGRGGRPGGSGDF